MKTEQHVDYIMMLIPEEWRKRWCGGERGACACLGCVQIGNRAVINDRITRTQYPVDPEHISEEQLKKHTDLYSDNKITREEWDLWMSRTAFRAGN